MPRILMVAPEASPYAKTGGLGDVLGSLPAALAKLGNEVAVVIPRYQSAEVHSPARIWDAMPLWVGSHSYTAAIDEVLHQGVRFFFVDCPVLYDRPGFYSQGGYDYLDNHIRFGLLNHAAIGIARNIFPVDIFHGHDWQAGLVAPYLRINLDGDPTFFGAKCVLTIHNLGYQGNFDASTLGDLGLSPALLHAEAFEFHHRISFLKAGIVWSDAITTVSPTYAKEILTPEFGFSFDGLLRSKAHKLTGILNGVDYSEWNPEHDLHIPAHYSAKDLSGKRACKKSLLQEMGLPDGPGRPLIGIVSRFASQKGFDLLASIAGDLAEENVAFAILGSGETWFEEMFRGFAHRWPDRFGLRIGYDNALAHRIEAGSDMILMPSRYEPCGLNQIYSLRYGTVPVVYATGGLEDTVDEETGFKFREHSSPALAAVVREALRAWQNQDRWITRMKTGMSKDFSWNQSAMKYQQVYDRLLGRAAAEAVTAA